MLAPKTMPRCIVFWASYFDGFLVDSCSQLEPIGSQKTRNRRLLERLVGHLAALLFSIVFSMPFLIDFWSILHSNLAPKIDQNRSKIDAKMHSILDSIFGSIFGRLWHLISTHWISKTMAVHSEKYTFMRARISKLKRFLIPTWCQLGSISVPKIH